MDRFVEIPGESWPWWRSLIELAALGSKPAEEYSLNRIHPTAGSVEGFLAARWLTAALEKAGPQPTRQRIVAAFESLSELDLGGFRLKLGPKDHQASDFVDLTFLGVQRWGPLSFISPADLWNREHSWLLALFGLTPSQESVTLQAPAFAVP